MSYEVKANRQYGSQEVYFDGKPSEEVITALKGLKMRWNPKKSCWYGFVSESELINAINGTGETVYTDGYLGGGAVYGSKSNLHLYGADLSKAIREELKAEGIKGCSVKCKSYAGGQSITVTVNATNVDLVPLDDYISDYSVRSVFNRLQYIDENENYCDMFIDDYYELDGEEQERIRVLTAKYEHGKASKEGTNSINHYHLDKYSEYKQEFVAKIGKINEIICRFRYDESNSMVDYFSTNFYYDIAIKMNGAN